jgi:hypothetical protein
VKSGGKNFDKKAIKEKEPKIKVLAHDFFLEHIEELHIFILRKRGRPPYNSHLNTTYKHAC